MYYIVSSIILIISVLLVLIVLVQNSKGGGLASNFTGGGQSMGVRKTTDFLEKSTWTLAAALLFFSLISAAVVPKNEVVRESKVKDQVINLEDGANELPSFPMDENE
jgi:preprotein translocase subunit SecG